MIRAGTLYKTDRVMSLFARMLTIFLLFMSLAAGSAYAEANPDLSGHPFLASVSSGAAPGYLPEEVCSNCHKSHYDSYQHVGMSQSFSDPSSAKVIEDFKDNHFYHEKSDRHYEMENRGDELFFRRYQLDHKGDPINLFEQRVDWVLGSGNRARSYLIRMPSGRMFQLPLGWYTQTSEWGMSPGYDKQYHVGLRREVRRECMFCHNAFPDVVEGSDTNRNLHLFPPDLPQGTGCQRCHGPGYQHVKTALGGVAPIEKIRGSVVNPGKLPPDRELQVCFQCHLLPSVTMTGIRRFDVPDYAYRPGDSLDDYLLNVDVDAEEEKRSDRFEINHHPYRLMQSQCFLKSEGTDKPMTCTSCHNPHFKPKGKERLTHFSERCQQCHEKHDRDRLMVAMQAHYSDEDRQYLLDQTVKDIGAPEGKVFEPDNCFACHMPQHRTRDVVKVTMTDHLIVKTHGAKKLLAPRMEGEPVLTNLEFYEKSAAPPGDEGEIYRVTAFLRHAVTENATNYLQKLLKRSPVSSPTPYSDLASALMKLKRYKEAIALFEEHLLPVDYPDSKARLAVVHLLNGDAEKAIRGLQEAIREEPARAASWYNLGLAYLESDQTAKAEPVLRKAVSLEPLLDRGWYYLGYTLRELDRKDEAIVALKQSLSVNPAFERPYKDLVELLVASGDKDQAERYLLRGRKNSRDPAFLDSVSLD